MNRILMLLCPVMLLCFATAARAANITAGSCSSSDVQSAINSASTGDTVTVPAGNCTWTSRVNIASKGITLTGAGADITNITDGASGALNITGASATNFVTVGGFTFIKSANNGGGAVIEFNGEQAAVAFRLHHSTLISASSGIRGVTVSTVYGLIDNFTWNISGSATGNQALSVYGTNPSQDAGYAPWQLPLSLGTDNAVYVEDSTMNYPSGVAFVEDSIDAYVGARLVIRHNKFNNISYGFHGTDSGGWRSPVSFEIYNNVHTNNSTGTLRATTIRGGTGVVYGNTYTAGTKGWGGITLMLYRVVQPAQVSAWGVCNGAQYKLLSTGLSSDLSRTCSISGTVGFSSTNRELIGTYGTSTFTTYFDGEGTGGYPCRDQPGVKPGQSTEPIYAWNNTGGVTIGTYDGGSGISDANYLQSGRDYVNNGSTPKPGYAAYAYPHPLRAGQIDTARPAAPRNLEVH